MDSNAKMGIVYPIMTLIFYALDSESGSFDEYLDLNEQKLNNGPRTQLVQ